MNLIMITGHDVTRSNRQDLERKRNPRILGA